LLTVVLLHKEIRNKSREKEWTLIIWNIKLARMQTRSKRCITMIIAS
jgi:hypothetical protein